MIVYTRIGNSNRVKWLGSGDTWEVQFTGFGDSFDVKGEVD